MALIVEKFGGTSAGSVARLKRIARRVARQHARGDQVVVVISAMKHTTDQFLALARKLNPEPPKRELDMLLTAGERIAMGLLSLAIWREGVPAESFTGSQSGIITDNSHTRARIIEVRAHRLVESLARGNVVIVAGFQGVSMAREITTLGRGGSDTTAAALACALGADACHIYTDVDGICTADPRWVPEARCIERIGVETMLDLAYLGAGVMHPRAIELVRRFGRPMWVSNALRTSRGTHIVPEESVELPIAQAITFTERLSPVTIAASGADSGDASALLERLHAADIALGFPTVSLTEHGWAVAAWLEADDRAKFDAELSALAARGVRVTHGAPTGIVTVVGAGLARDVSLHARILTLLADAHIAVARTWTTQTAICCAIPPSEGQRAVQELHRALIA